MRGAQSLLEGRHLRPTRRHPNILQGLDDAGPGASFLRIPAFFLKRNLELFRSIDSVEVRACVHVAVPGDCRDTVGLTLIMQLRTMFALLFSGIETREERELKLNP